MVPHDDSYEAAVIGSMIIDSACVAGVRTFIKTPAAFFIESNQIVAAVIFELADGGQPIDAMILHRTLAAQGKLEEVGGLNQIKVLAYSVPTSAHAEYYAAQVQEMYQRREQIRVHQVALKEAVDGDGNAEDIRNVAIERLSAIEVGITRRAVTSHESLIDTLAGLEKSWSGEVTGIPTGLIELDNLIGGLQKGEVIVIAARTSVGKSALTMNIIEHVSLGLKIPAAIFSLEMSAKQLMQRLITSRSGIDNHKLRSGRFTEAEKANFGYAVGDISSGGVFYIDDTPCLTTSDFRSKAKALVRDKGVRLIALDYLQLMESTRRGGNRQEEISRFSREVKGVARDLDVSIIEVSQLNRASETEGRLPRTSDLRESGAIENDADTIILLHREAVLHRGDNDWMQNNADKVNLAMAIVAKNRQGPCDAIKLTFLGAQTRFVNYNPGV